MTAAILYSRQNDAGSHARTRLCLLAGKTRCRTRTLLVLESKGLYCRSLYRGLRYIEVR